MKSLPHAAAPLAALCCIPAARAAELRPLSTDRPDTTESAWTVDAGHYQFEMEVAAFTRDGGEWAGYSLGELNAKFGLAEAADLQLVVPFHVHLRGAGEGYGDIEVRLKYNLWGNAGGDTAMALMPFVKIPTARDGLGNGDVEGGLIVPFAFAGTAGWSCAVMGQVDVASDADGSGRHLVGLVSATASHGMTERTAGFVEGVGIFSADSGAEVAAYFNTGMTWAVTPCWQVDGGVRVGLTGAVDDLTPFLGLSTKF